MAEIKARNVLCRYCHTDVQDSECECDAGTYTLVSWDCTSCGTEVVTSGGHDVECRKCNASYNGSGQRLRDDWRRNASLYDDEIGDMEGYEMAHADW